MKWWLLIVTGCGRIGFDHSAATDASSAGAALVVTMTADRMAGPATLASIDELPAGTVGLSLREALAIAANHPGPDRIVFDSSVFPPAAPATIAIGAELDVEDTATKLDASGAGVAIAPDASYAGRLVAISGNDAELDDLVLMGGDTGVAVVAGTTGVTLAALDVRSPANDAILVDTASQIAIVDCRVSGAGPKPIHVLSSTDVTIDHAFVALATKVGVVYGIQLESSQRVQVLDSVVDPGTAWMIALQDTTDSVLRGNILDGGDTDIVLFGASHRNTVFLNVGIAPVYHIIYVDTAAQNNTLLNNTAFNAPAGSEIYDLGTGTMIANTLISTSATDFVNPSAPAYDFHLVAGSPSIDAAMDVGQNMLPHGDGVQRFLGAGPDLGAVESY